MTTEHDTSGHNAGGQGPQLHIGDFSGPLELLFHLIEKNKVDIYDIPIALITEQYLGHLESLGEVDMELASDFLLMASTLLQIKSALLLPLLKPAEEEKEEDPRDELVMRLLAYRRARLLASEIARRQDVYQGCQFHLPETPKQLGITVKNQEAARPITLKDFQRGAQSVSRRNQARFTDVGSRMVRILQREKVSLREKIASIWKALIRRGSLFFTELFPYGASRAEKVTGFLAVLELLKANRINARQDEPLDVIELEYNSASDNKDASDALAALIQEGKLEDYD